MWRQALPPRPAIAVLRLLLLLVVLAIAAAASLLGGVLRDGGTAGASPSLALQARSLEAGLGAGATADIVRDLQRRLRVDGSSARDWAVLGLGYQQLARESGDASFYGKSRAALRRALELDSNDLTATIALGSLALSQHRFREAHALGLRARSLSPSTARSYGVLGDALVELGRYREAFRAFRTMTELKPTSSAYARSSYTRELVGDRSGALRWMRLARDATVGQREPYAWTSVQLGNLHWDAGRIDAAAAEYRSALNVLPGYVYALDGLARVAVAANDVDRAIALQQRAVDAMPLPQFVNRLGDHYRLAGRGRDARAQYATVAAIERLQRAGGVATDLEAAAFAADHGRPSISLARRAHAARPSVDGDDVLAWTLARAGRCGEALAWSRRSLRLGSVDALKFFHRAWIERCLGDRPESRLWARRAVRLNPHFSLLWASTATRLAR